MKYRHESDFKPGGQAFVESETAMRKSLVVSRFSCYKRELKHKGRPADRALGDNHIVKFCVLASGSSANCALIATEKTRVLVDIGATLRAAGQRTAAREPLLEGLALAARCGARALERRARAELAAVGVRPRTPEHSGARSLTPSERRVVELAAAGGTNREIAQSLFVTEKTVETLLGRAFRKLDVSSRRQLPDVLARAAE